MRLYAIRLPPALLAELVRTHREASAARPMARRPTTADIAREALEAGLAQIRRSLRRAAARAA